MSAEAAILLAVAEVAAVLLLMFVWKRRPPPGPSNVDMDIDGSEGAVLSDLTDAYADALIAASEAAGRPATHCEGAACFEADRCLCECACNGCDAALALLVRAGVEVRAATRRELGAALADVERGIKIPKATEDRILSRLLARRRGAPRS